MGVITGQYTDASNVQHGFLRAPDGNITTFDPPGSVSTEPTSINPAGAITGYYRDASRGWLDFLRDRDGTFTIFDPNQYSPFTAALSINPAGAIAGVWWDYSVDMLHGFLRASDGNITSFNTPEFWVVYSFAGAMSINPAGVITGGYEVFDMNLHQVFGHGFVRAPTSGVVDTDWYDGTITTFDPPGSIYTVPWSINPAGAITGQYVTASYEGHGFLRAPDGTITTFDPPESIYTFARAINPGGTIVGGYRDAASYATHGFLRAANGTYTTFDPPGSTYNEPVAINPRGEVTGGYQDADGVSHGYVWRQQF